ncbi:hypothetical protein JL721_2236 [Aureococcus anophagefferens]|nr:hypothetical protein JL721_2236 [Aureococcus anophagefferens]
MLLPLAFLFGGAHGFGYSQTVDNCAETPHTFDRSCSADCPQCTPIAVTNVVAQDLSDASGCVCVEGSIRAGSSSSGDDDGVICDGEREDEFCDCDGDCDENPAWCQCDEAQACCSGDASTWTLTPYDDCAFLGSIGDYAGLHTGAGNDVVDVLKTGENSEIDAGDGDDEVSIVNAYVTSVVGGAGDDTIYIVSTDCYYRCGKVDGGGGDDKITILHSETKEIFGGAGDDAISIGYAKEGKIYGGDGDDTIDLVSGGYDTDKELLLDGGYGAAPAPREAPTVAQCVRVYLCAP